MEPWQMFLLYNTFLGERGGDIFLEAFFNKNVHQIKLGFSA